MLPKGFESDFVASDSNVSANEGNSPHKLDVGRVGGKHQSHPAPPLKRLWPWYRVNFEHDCGGDFHDSPARNEEHARAIAFIQRACRGFRITSVEFATWHPSNRAMMGQGTVRERAA